MKRRLLCLGLLAAVSQLFGTGCLFHPVARYRANHPEKCGKCNACAACHPLLHPIQTRRAMAGGDQGVATVGPVVGGQPCQSCNGGTVQGAPVTFNGAPGDVVPVTNPPAGYPSITYPMPITGGPTVVPEYPLPMPKSTDGK